MIRFCARREAIVTILLVTVVICDAPQAFSASHPIGSSIVASPVPTTTGFSARLIWRRGGKVSKAQLFVKDNRYRIEYFGGLKTELGFAGVTIVRLDQRKVWYIYSDRRLVLSVPVTKQDVLPFSVTLEGEIKRTLIGDAYVGKRPATLFDVEVVTESGKHEAYYEWVDAEREVLLKLLSRDRDWWVEYEHVVISQQPDFYFEIPLGYRKVEARESYPDQEE
ncbi:MAG: hypothetical protein MRJ96_01560 [Nitrospirales bacterium]|nr:hypothetical protein [Nitrospira sp.]MDR4500130.1 hypothetical protein [Nitrospirales bacterium]